MVAFKSLFAVLISMINFDRMIDNFLHKEDRPKDIGRYYPSEIGTCMRKVWYSYKYPQKIKPELLKIFEVGNIMHDFVVKVLNSEKNPDIMLVSAELPFRKEVDDFIVSGRVDDIILVKASGKNVLIEVKSTGNADMVNEPVYYNKMQLQFYMYATHVHNGVLLYVDKSTLETKSFEVKFSEKRGRRILNKFRALHKHLTNCSLPAAEAKKAEGMGWMCRYCEYKAKCGRNEK